MAGVIKANEMARPGKRHTGFELGDFIVEGRQIIQVARAKADQMLVETRAEAERLKTQAAEKGYGQGYQRGIEEGQADGHRQALEKASAEFEARHVQLASACESLFREVDRRKRDLLMTANRDLIVLAVAIAERVTKRIGVVDRRAVTDNLLGVIDLVGRTSDLVVEVNPADAETLEKFAASLVARRGELEHVEVRENDQVDPGGCIVRTRAGEIDARLETQLQRIAEELVPGLTSQERPVETGGETDAASD
ncbi:MAG: hypothetical protein JXQ73_24975 [Phycisphaerae bacterium]|nr:hypothetical protein [Phycisphaerae bacterium]